MASVAVGFLGYRAYTLLAPLLAACCTACGTACGTACCTALREALARLHAPPAAASLDEPNQPLLSPAAVRSDGARDGAGDAAAASRVEAGQTDGASSELLRTAVAAEAEGSAAESLATWDEERASNRPTTAGPTAAANCVVLGEGLSKCEVRVPASFVIEARDKHGVRRPHGGDDFVVNVRGPATTKAKVGLRATPEHTAFFLRAHCLPPPRPLPVPA